MRGNWLTIAAMFAALVLGTQSALAYKLQFVEEHGYGEAGGRWGDAHTYSYDIHSVYSSGSGYEDDIHGIPQYWGGGASAGSSDLSSGGGVGPGNYYVAGTWCDMWASAEGTWCDVYANMWSRNDFRLGSQYNNTGSVTLTLHWGASGDLDGGTNGSFHNYVDVQASPHGYTWEGGDLSGSFNFSAQIGEVIEISCGSEAWGETDSWRDVLAWSNAEVWLEVPPEVPVPEPMTPALLALGALAVVRRRRG